MVNPIPDRTGKDPRWDELGKYIRGVADAMGLSQWYFKVLFDKPSGANEEDEESYASVQIMSQSVSAYFRVGDSFWTDTTWEQRWIIVHELIHVIETAYIKALYEALEAPSVAKNIINQLRERFIDQIALMLAPTYTLPPEGFAPPGDASIGKDNESKSF